MATSARISGNPIFVCVPAGSKAGTTKIDYNRGSGPLVKVWWQNLAPTQSGWDYMRDPADPKKPINPSKGAFDFSVVAGQVTTFELYPSDLVAPSGNPLATANVFGFDANPPADKWGIDGPRIEVGGTFCDIFDVYNRAAYLCTLGQPSQTWQESVRILVVRDRSFDELL